MSYYKGQIKEAEGYFNSVIFAYWVLSLFFSILLLLGVIYIADLLNIPDGLVLTVKGMFLLSGLAMMIGLATSTLGIGTYIKNRLDLSASRSLTTSIINVICIVALFYFFTPNVIYVSIAAFVCCLVNVVFNIQFKRSLLPEFRFNPINGHSWKKIKTLVSSGVWNSVNQLSNVLLTQLDLLITNIFISAAATGDYALVKMIPTLIYNLLAMLSGSFTPNFNILYAQGKTDELLHEIKKSMKIVGTLMCIPIGFLMVFGDEFYHLWVPSIDSNYLAELSFITLLPMIFGSSINPIFGVFSITNKLKIPSLAVLIAGSLNTAAVFILLKTTDLGIWAIPIVGAIQQGLRNLFFTPIYASICLKQKLFEFYPTVGKCLLALLVVCFIGVVVKNWMSGDSWLMFILEGVMVSTLSLIINSFVTLSKSDRAYMIRTIKNKIPVK